MFVIGLGILALLIPVWLFLVIGKFIAQFTNSDFMIEWSWWVVMAPVWIPIVLFLLVMVGTGFLLLIMKFGFGFTL